ncbi:MAG: ABC transporter permease [Deltaproteobacteria bacterium]|nr:ABC transporter permease [Deltaproteobacteria bacterium]
MKRFLIRILALAHKETIHIARDVQVIYMALGMPVVLLLLFGYAISFDLDRLPTCLIDQDRSPASRRLAQAVTASGAFAITARSTSSSEVEASFRRNEFKVAVVIPAGFDRALRRDQASDAQVLLDGSDGTTTGIAVGYLVGIAQSEAARVLGERASFTPQVEARVRSRFNPGMESARYIVPGLIALILATIAVLLTALTVAREWERGSMEQLFSTPVGRLEVVLGKLLPYLVLGMVQVLLVVTLGTWLFDVPVEGSLWLLFGISALFLICMLGQGLLISVLTRNQMVATMAGALSSMVPTILLSGFLIPIENMPWALRALSALIPARYFVVVLRGILLKGNSAVDLWPQVLALTVFALAMVLLSTLRFRRRLD